MNFENFENDYGNCKLDTGEDLTVAYISETNSIESDTGGIKCPNCNENMFAWNHTCDEKNQEKMQTTDKKSICGTMDETENEGGRVESVPKLTKVQNGQSQYYTYCCHAEKKLANGLGHSDGLTRTYYRCMSCNGFLCYNCFGSYFRWKTPNAPICCKNVKLSDVNYDKELKPK